jgi:hypothetical protein
MKIMRLMKENRRPLSSRRSVQCRDLAKTVRTFLSTPIAVDEVRAAPKPGGRRRVRTARVLPIPEEVSDTSPASAQRRAFERDHAKKSKALEATEERTWRKSEIFRKWRNDHMKRPETSRMQKDELQTETVIGERNEWYLATIKNWAWVTVGSSLRTVRGLPEGMKLSSAARNSNMYSW